MRVVTGPPCRPSSQRTAVLEECRKSTDESKQPVIPVFICSHLVFYEWVEIKHWLDDFYPFFIFQILGDVIANLTDQDP